jgi:hypothetical protein
VVAGQRHAGHAHLTGAAVEAVIAWEFPLVYGYPAPMLDGVNFEELATNVVKDAIAEATDGTGPGRIYYKVVEGIGDFDLRWPSHWETSVIGMPRASAVEAK